MPQPLQYRATTYFTRLFWSNAPDLILIRIFELSAQAALQDRGLPFAILASHVCKHWRTVITSSRYVWCTIPVHPLRPGLTQFFLSLAGTDGPLHVCLHMNGDVYNDLRFILMHAERVKELHLRAYHGLSFGVQNLVLKLGQTIQLPALKHLELVSTSPDDDLSATPILLYKKPLLQLNSVVINRASFHWNPPRLLTGLTHLTWAIPIKYIVPLSYASLRDVALACPALEYLKLDGVFPILTQGVSYPKMNWPALRTLEFTMDRNPTTEKAAACDPAYLSDFFSLFSVPAVRTFTFESDWQVAWEGLWSALPVLKSAFSSILTLRLSLMITTNGSTPDVYPGLFSAFPDLRYLTITAPDDRTFQACLHPWIAHLVDDTGTGWPKLELLTLRTTAVTHCGSGAADEGSTRDAVDLIESLRATAGMPFDLYRHCVNPVS